MRTLREDDLLTTIVDQMGYPEEEEFPIEWFLKVLSIVLRKFNSGYNRLAASDLDGRLASRLQCTCLGLDARRTIRYRPAGGCSPLLLEN